MPVLRPLAFAVLFLLLLGVEAVGFVQSAMAALVLAASVTLWERKSAAEIERTLRSGLSRGSSAMAATSFGLAVMLFAFSFAGEYVSAEAELLWLLAAGPAAISLGIAVFRGGTLPGGTSQAVMLGLVTTACWVPIGVWLGLDRYLRFHPRALEALGGWCRITQGSESPSTGRRSAVI